MLKPLAVKQMQQEVVEHKIALNFFFFFLKCGQRRQSAIPQVIRKERGREQRSTQLIETESTHEVEGVFFLFFSEWSRFYFFFLSFHQNSKISKLR